MTLGNSELPLLGHKFSISTSTRQFGVQGITFKFNINIQSRQIIFKKNVKYLKHAERHPLHGADLGLADGDTVELRFGAEDLLQRLLLVKVGEGFLENLGWTKAFGHSRVDSSGKSQWPYDKSAN